jgi:hypothetical protein
MIEPTTHHTTQPTTRLDLYGAGIKTCKPITSAVAQEQALDRIMSRRLLVLSDALSKTATFPCFYIHHAVSIISDEVPLGSALAVDIRCHFESLLLEANNYSKWQGEDGAGVMP